MGKRFEGEEPTFIDMLMAFELLGLNGCLGDPGEKTVYASRYPLGEIIEFSVVPGNFTANEIEDLRTWAA